MSGLLLHIVFALGGGLGAVARHKLTRLVTHQFPLATLIVNVVGCFLLGAAIAGLSNTGQLASEESRRLVFGFSGGFTTFSSFAYQSLNLHKEYSLLHAAGNIVVSLVLCLIAYGLGGLIFVQSAP